EMRNEKPLPGQKNYFWLKVKRRGRGQEIPKSPEVNVYYNKEVTEYHWPNSFKEAKPEFELKEFDLKLKDKKQIWIGPFEYIPSSNQVCIFARINTENDTAIVSFNSNHNLPLWMIVPYDNNIAVRIFD
ncbi:MAG: hypothetical protein KAQ95_07805, partial [Candidatus Heimdallarchaeota archaeon]|nr:hypothetical protein [Candidatus Heimdallarchaeota archaeon]